MPNTPPQLVAIACLVMAAQGEYHVERFLRERDEYLRSFIEIPADDQLDGGTPLNHSHRNVPMEWKLPQIPRTPPHLTQHQSSKR